MKTTKIEFQLNRIEDLLKVRQAKPMDFKSACRYLNVSKSFLYKLTSKNQIPYYKPSGKLLFFEKAELTKWLLSKRSMTDSELKEDINKFIQKNKRS